VLFQLPKGSGFAIPDDWWEEAGTVSFVPNSQAYPTKPFDERPDWPIILVPPRDLEPPRRDPGFELDFGGFNRARMIGVLREIASGLPMCAIEVEEHPLGSPAFRLRHGFHRYYASIAVGFERIPVAIFARW
jgi:hypothetical protein